MAAQINIAMHNGGVTVTGMSPASNPTTQGSVVNTSTDTWNNVANNGGAGTTFSGLALSLTDGSASGATLSANSGFTNFNNIAWASNNKDWVMMEGWYGFVGSEHLTLSNLPAADANGYTVTIYGDVAQNRTMNYSINGGTAMTITDTGGYAGTFNAENSVTFANITGTTTLAITGNASGSRSAINGLTVQYTPVPEPSSTALLGLGGLALILRRRK
ncbi:MAG: PEP-CTERM sorting domain-containing protein [Akkermansiaceae bacterium]